MGEALATADGTAIDLGDVDVDREFAAAMAAPEPGEAPDYPAPPRKKDPDAPHGRADDGTPLAPYGYKPDGRPRMVAAGPGRGHKKDDAPRVQRAPAAAGGGKTVARADYAEPLSEFADGLWMLMAGTPIPWDKFETARVKIRVQAALLKSNKAGLVNAANSGAQHNATVRAGVEKITSGSASWVLPAMFMITPFVAQTALLWRSPIDEDLLSIAAQTETEWDQFSQEQIAAMAGRQETE